MQSSLRQPNPTRPDAQHGHPWVSAAPVSEGLRMTTVLIAAADSLPGLRHLDLP